MKPLSGRTDLSGIAQDSCGCVSVEILAAQLEHGATVKFDDTGYAAGRRLEAGAWMMFEQLAEIEGRIRAFHKRDT